MDTKIFINKLNRLYKKENGCPMTDNGYRVRITKECQDMDNNIIELGYTYFYSSQAHVESTADEVRFWAKHMGIEISLDPITDKRFHMRQWPNESWATQLYRIDIA